MLGAPAVRSAVVNNSLHRPEKSPRLALAKRGHKRVEERRAAADLFGVVRAPPPDSSINY
jgi:hypothetical protein